MMPDIPQNYLILISNPIVAEVRHGQFYKPLEDSFRKLLGANNYAKESAKTKEQTTHFVLTNEYDSRGTKLSLIRSLQKLKEKIELSSVSLNKSTIDSIDDALKFLSILPQDDSSGFISVADEDSEVILRWYNGKQWVNVHFDGSHKYEYAYMQDGKFVGGKEIGNLERFIMPADLESYLVSLFKNAV
jgi:hypothetical protein